MFSSCFFFNAGKVPRHLQLLVKWEVVSPNSRYREILSWDWKYWKVPLHLLVKWGRWFLQIVDIHVGNFNMKLTGTWFPQIVDMDSGNLYPIYIYNKNCGVSLWTCSREISGDRVALFFIGFPCSAYVSSVMRSSSHFGTPGFNIQDHPKNEKKKFILWIIKLLPYFTCMLLIE